MLGLYKAPLGGFDALQLFSGVSAAVASLPVCARVQNCSHNHLLSCLVGHDHFLWLFGSLANHFLSVKSLEITVLMTVAHVGDV